MKTLLSGYAALLLGPGRNHAVAARVRNRLPQMLVLIFENVHQRVLLRPVSSEQFHRRLQVVVGKSGNRFLQIEVRSLQSFLHFLRIRDGRGRCPRSRRARKHAGEQAVLFNDQVEHIADGANAFAGFPVVLARHDARECGELVRKRSGIFGEGGLNSCRLRRRQRRHQSKRKRAQPVPIQNPRHVDLLYVTKRLVLLVTPITSRIELSSHHFPQLVSSSSYCGGVAYWAAPLPKDQFSFGTSTKLMRTSSLRIFTSSWRWSASAL